MFLFLQVLFNYNYWHVCVNIHRTSPAMHVCSWHSSTSQCLYPPCGRVQSPSASHGLAWHLHFYQEEVLFSTLQTTTSEWDCQHNDVSTPVRILPSDANTYKHMPHAFKSIYSISWIATFWLKRNSSTDLGVTHTFLVLYLSSNDSPDLVALLFRSFLYSPHHNPYHRMTFSIPC